METQKWKYLNQIGVWPSGNPRLYIRKRRGNTKAVPLPDISIASPSFPSVYLRALEAYLAQESGWLEVRKSLSNCFKKAKARAVLRGRLFTIRIDDLEEMLERQARRCAVTNLPFDLVKPEKSRRMPFSPSIDRVNPHGGYTIDNIRLVSVIANIALSDFGDEAFMRMCRGAVTVRSKKRHNFAQGHKSSLKNV